MSARSKPSSRWSLRVAVAIGAALLVIAAVVYESHQSERAKAAISPPRCTKADDRYGGVVHDGFLVECGPASAVVGSDGHWHVMETGFCSRNTQKYFGIRTRRDVPHAYLTLRINEPSDGVTGIPKRARGEIELNPGIDEQVVGGVARTADFLGGTFILRGLTSGHTYVGSFYCDKYSSWR